MNPSGLMLALSLLAAACGSTRIDLDSYSKACASHAECAPAFGGDACATCTCPNGAIATSSSSRHQTDLQAAQRFCGARLAIACECAEAVARCEAGTCGLGPQ